ncbi:MAG: hypothetical protein H6696_16510 [Deferribacteres bacterium]|nr:hypothetical protein [candidate division KSB1 bacterium]MCB9503536.1 hypothetical protein [Deferribacteres bacterium]
MNLWQKIKDGAAVVADKASDLVEAGGEFLQQGSDKIKSDESGTAVNLSKLQAEVVELRATIQNYFTTLGGEVYVLYISDKKDEIVDSIISDIARLEMLREELEAKEQMLTRLSKVYEAQSISMRALKILREELESADGTIEHLTVSKESPYVGLTLSEIDKPADILLGVILRGEDLIIPCGETQIEVGDRIMLMGKKEAVIAFLHKFNPEAE